jgi:hypothetical protein
MATIKRKVPEIKVDWDEYDAFGSTMAWWFGCADALSFAGEWIPDEWEYVGQHLLDLDEDEDFNAVMLTEYVENGDLTWDDVRHFGNVFQRYRENLGRLGRDY